jgi:hypothetical protein
VDTKKEDDGLLQVPEIMRLPLNADLATLSACNTGVGAIQGEEGMTSLTEAFFIGGARAVVSSLWTKCARPIMPTRRHYLPAIQVWGQSKVKKE